MSNNLKQATKLSNLKDQMMELLDEMYDTVRAAEDSNHIQDRARSYWYNQIKGTLGSEEILGGSMCSVDDTIKELRDNVIDQDDEDWYHSDPMGVD